MQFDQQTTKGKAQDCEPEAVETEGRISNSILTSLPKAEFDAILPHLEFVEMQWRRVVHEPALPIEYGYFPNGGIVSLVVPVSDGRSAEVGIVGKDGFVGTSLVSGMTRTTQMALVQVASTAVRVSAQDLNRAISSSRALRELLIRYALIQGMEVAQTAACNRFHDLPQRLARWLLMSHAKLKCNVLPYTHELLATMLGSGRPSVTLATQELERNGSIRQGRGNIEILDRNSLEACSCECYAVTRDFE